MMRLSLLVMLVLLQAACLPSFAPTATRHSSNVRLARGAPRPDRLPELVTCSTPPGSAPRRSHAVATVRMLVKEDGGVDVASITPIGRISYGRISTKGALEDVQRLRGKEIFIREWAARNAATCQFTPGSRNGNPVAVPVQVWFGYSE